MSKKHKRGRLEPFKPQPPICDCEQGKLCKEVQEYIVAECMEEMKERAKQRANAAERKRRSRGGKANG